MDEILHRSVFPWLLVISRVRPDITARANRAVAPTLDHARRVGRSDLMLSTPMPAVHRETEAAVPMAKASEAFERLVRLVEREGLRVNFIVEVRFVRGDAAWMSPAHGGDTCQIGAYMAEGPDLAAYFAGFWREMRVLGARPHWGKEMDHGVEELRSLYPAMGRFLALRDEMDPARVLSSRFQERVLGV
jgi:L-gulonolactone oxidase